jgi:succinate-acetate transporter protein
LDQLAGSEAYIHAQRPVYIFFGGLMLLLAGIGEWILGDSFYSVAFFTYGESH